MKTVPREQMIETWERLCDLDEKQSAAMSKKFLEEQPALGVYLLASTENMGKEAEPSPIIELAIAVWEVMSPLTLSLVFLPIPPAHSRSTP